MNIVLSKDELGIIDAIGIAFKLLKKNFVLISKLFFSTAAPFLLLIAGINYQFNKHTASILTTFATIGLVVATTMIYAASIHITKESLLQNNLSFNSVISFSKDKIIKIFLASLVSLLVIIPVILVGFILESISQGLIYLFMFVFAIGFIYASLRFIFFPVAVVIDDKKAFESYEFSWNISRDKVSTIFGLSILLFLISFPIELFTKHIGKSLPVEISTIIIFSIISTFINQLLAFLSSSAVTCYYLNLTYEEPKETEYIDSISLNKE